MLIYHWEGGRGAIKQPESTKLTFFLFPNGIHFFYTSRSIITPNIHFATTLHKVRNLTGIFPLASWEMTTMLRRWAGPFKCLFIHNFTCPVLWLNRNCITINLMTCAAQQYGIHCAYLYSAQKEEIYFCLKIYMGINMSSLQTGENTEPDISWRKKCIWKYKYKQQST